MAKQVRVRWTAKDMTLSTFVQKYEDKLPVIIIVTGGFSGNDAILHTYSSDEVYLVCGVQTQQRVLLQDEKGQFFSIPKIYRKNRFQKVKKDGAYGAPDYLAQHLKNPRNLNIVPEDNKSVDYLNSMRYEASGRLGKLRIEQVYNEKYFVAYSIQVQHGPPYKTVNTSKLPTAIPAYMDLHVAVAEGLKEASVADLMKLTTQFLPPKNVDFKKVRIPMSHDIIMRAPEEPDLVSMHPPQWVCLGSPPSSLEMYYPIPKADIPDMTQCTLYGALPPVPERRPLARKASTSPATNPSNQEKQPPQTKPKPVARPRQLQETQQAAVARRPREDALNHAPNRPSAVISPIVQVSPAAAAAATVVATAASADPDDDDYEKVDPDPAGPIRSMEDIPSNIASLSTTRLTACMKLLGLSEYVNTFFKEGIDGDLLQSLSEDVLKEDLRLSRLDAIKLVRFAKGWRPMV